VSAGVTAAVVGAGVMGSGIAQTLAVAGAEVRCQDVAAGQLEKAAEAVRTGRYGLERSVELGKASQADADAALGRLTFTTSLEEAVAGADLVLEAIPEKLPLKLRLFLELDGLAPADAVLATNSSGFPVSAMAAVTDRPERVIGWHWASPPVAMKLAEIVTHPGTSDETVELVRALAEACGKHPVVVKENPMVWGYVANRVFAAAAREANQIVQEGLATREQVDRLVTDAYRWPAGVFGIAAGASEGWTEKER
jgi:3-hydroxybutyryl-CoA dehydrogenase